MLDRVTAALAAITPRGAFAAERACPSEGLSIEVKGVGPIRFPISATTARALCAVAQPAPFGRRDKTLHDPRIRDTWEIGKRRIKIDARRWKLALEPALASLREKLGLPGDGKLLAVLDKMLVYTPGQFFAAHQDSERDDDMVGSLVVELPSVSSGGAVIVHHHGEKKTFRRPRRGASDLSLLAFYADCHHEVKPIASGHRVVLTYHLLHRPVASPRAQVPPLASAAVDHLAESVEAHFSTPIARGYGNPTPQRPDRLIYLLDHEYTEKSLAWTRLKNGDRLRVGALLKVAERFDCESYLCLADVHENWTCEDDWGQHYRWRGRRYDREPVDDDDTDDESSEHVLVDLCDSDVELRHWIASDGHTGPSVSVSPTDSEICFTKASVELDPFKSEHEGYMGNYGNTVDRWYHRAAFVMWPRARNFVIRAKVSPSWAVSELAARIAKRALSEARDDARSLLPFWRQHAPNEAHHAFFPKLLKVALSLDDAELAHGLLAPFGPHRLSVRALPVFARLVEAHGLAWSRRLFDTWFERVGNAPPWLALLPELFRVLSTGTPRHGSAVAAWLLNREVNACEQAILASLRRAAIWPGAAKTGNHLETVLALLEAAAVIEAASTRDHFITLLTTGEIALPILDAGALLEKCCDGRPPAAVRALGLSALFRYVVDGLERTLAVPERGADNWSIGLTLVCSCELCAVLSAFLSDRARIEHVWPLAEARRRHIHDVIGLHHLPVAHVTTRRGSPYSLVLTKQRAIFEGEAALRARQRFLLGFLKRHRDAFVGGES